jgi:hypothetical protein
MPTVFPGALDVLVNPTPGDSLSTPAVLHSSQHANINDAVEAIQALIGVTGSTVTGTLIKRLADAEANISSLQAVVATLGGGTNPGTTPQAPIQLTAPAFASTTALVGETITVTLGTYIGNPTPTVTRVWRKDSIILAGVTGTSYTTTAAGTYTVDETASNGVGSPITRSTVVGVTVTPIPVIPSIPQGFSAGTASDVAQVLNWVAPVTGYPATYTYTITRRTGGAAYGNAVTTAAGATTVTITGLTASTAYDYLITATNTTGTGTAASITNLSTTAAPGGSSVYADNYADNYA